MAIMDIDAPEAAVTNIVWKCSGLCVSGVGLGVSEGIGVADGEGVDVGSGDGEGEGGVGVYSHSGSSMVALEMSKGVIRG